MPIMARTPDVVVPNCGGRFLPLRVAAVSVARSRGASAASAAPAAAAAAAAALAAAAARPATAAHYVNYRRD